jgi:hypothetical protein
MEVLGIVVSATVFLATYLLGRSITRATAVLDQRLAVISNAIKQSDAGDADSASPLDRHTVASIAGVLLAQRLSSSTYQADLEAALANVLADPDVASVSPALAAQSAEHDRTQTSDVLLERERDKCVLIALNLLDHVDEGLAKLNAFQGRIRRM